MEDTIPLFHICTKFLKELQSLIVIEEKNIDDLTEDQVKYNLMMFLSKHLNRNHFTYTHDYSAQTHFFK